MSTSPEFSSGNFVPENYVIPEDSEQLQEFLKKTFEEHARFLNRKETAQFETVEVQVNQSFPGANPQSKRQVSRKIFEFGALAVGGILNIPHLVTGTLDFTRIFGTAITAADTRPLPFNSTAAANQGIMLLVAGANIIVTNGGAAPALISGRVILEFMKS